ncbi:MAG: 30S ribosomal protein S16 [Chloroflexi bacterium]|nr:30S ribosomal protein S16 [Chloroflexota bacterium]
MVRIRLRRVGQKGQPIYRIVAADQRTKRDGRYIEILGHYNPRTDPETIEFQEDRMLHWLNVGAQPSESVAILLRKAGTLERFERLRKGESIEALAAEAVAKKEAAGPINAKTRFMAPIKKEA